MKDPIVSKFLQRARAVKNKIRAIFLFGSRARGNARPDSDYDLLLVVAEDFTVADKDKLYDIVMDILLETGRLVSLKIFKQAVFQKLRRMGTPFTQNVVREGIKIG